MKRCIYHTTILAVAALLLMVMPAAAYTIDGDCSDWGVNPTNDLSNPNRLDDSSLIPTIGGISYAIENDDADWAYGAVRNNMSNFTGLEWCDIEAMYVDDDSEFIYVLLITSMPKNGMNWGSDHIQPGDLAFDFNEDGIFEYGVKIVQNDEQGGFGSVGAIYSDLTWAVLDPGTDRTEIVSIVGGTYVGSATIEYTGTGGDPVSGVNVSAGPVDSGLPCDTFGTTVYHSYSWGKNPSISNEIIEIAIPKSALGMPTTANIQSSITCGNGVIKLESVSLIPEFVTLAIPVVSLLGLVFYMRRKERK